MSLEPATIRRIATLARIHVEDAELATLAAELNGILGWIEQLNEVNVDGIEPLTGARADGAEDARGRGDGWRLPRQGAGQRAGAGRGLFRRAQGGRVMAGSSPAIPGTRPGTCGGRGSGCRPKLCMNLTDLTIAAARDGLRAREFTARELTEAHLAAIEALNPRLNAYITVTGERALAQADAADAALARGEFAPLTGIPLAIKDLFCTEGVRTTAGSRILGPFVPPYESTVSANLLRDGAVFLGKANMDEFAMGSSNMTSAYGPVANPWKRRQDTDGGAGAGRLVRRLGGRGVGAAGDGRDRHRYRRLDPPAGVVLRHRRHEADLWPVLALGRGGVRVVARSSRPVRAHRGGLRDPARLDGGA